MTPKQYKISKESWTKFQEHYAWQLLKSPDYRLGQAFLNYFNKIDLGTQDSVALYYETDHDRAMIVITAWLD